MCRVNTDTFIVEVVSIYMCDINYRYIYIYIYILYIYIQYLIIRNQQVNIVTPNLELWSSKQKITKELDTQSYIIVNFLYSSLTELIPTYQHTIHYEDFDKLATPLCLTSTTS